MNHLRLAAVQLDYQPVTRTSVGGWRLDEPLAPLEPLANTTSPDFFLQTLKGKHTLLRNVCEKTMKECRQAYVTNLTEKLQEIMSFCYTRDVDLVVFPEYSIPIEAIDALLAFPDLAIIAGLGYLRRPDIKIYKSLNLDTSEMAPGNNLAVLLSPNTKKLIAKKHPAEKEEIQRGAGPIIEKVDLQNSAFTVGVSICLDFIQERTSFFQTDVDIVAIPALSSNTQEFVDFAPRNFVRIFANHAAFGGTYIGAPHIKGGLKFVESKRGTVPLSSGLEGIIIVDWDFENPYPEQPKQTIATDHRLYARAALIYGGRDSGIAQRISRIDEQMPYEDVLENLVQLSLETASDIQSARKTYELVRDALDMIDSENLDEDEVRALSRHCVLSTNILSAAELKYKTCVSVADQLKRLQDTIPDIAAPPYGEYEKVAATLAEKVRANILALRHRVPIGPAESDVHDRSQLVLFARLGPYGGEEAIRSLTRQLTLLRTIADLQDPGLTLRYRLETWRDSANIMHAVYDVICTTAGYSQPQLEELRQGVGQLIHITFTGAYSISYTIDPATVDEETADIRESCNWWGEIGRVLDEKGIPLPFLGMTDWGLVVDLLRSLNELTVVELHCRGLPFVQHDAMARSEETSQRARYAIEGSPSAGQLFSEMLEREKGDQRRLLLRAFVGSKEPLPTGIVNAIGIELAGTNRFEVIENRRNDGIVENVAEFQKLAGIRPAEALLIFHPPFGTIYAISGERRVALELKTNETKFPATGVTLGTARTRQIRSDEEIEVRLAEDDRLRHVYVVGKTGTGKTNLLKTMASKDVQKLGRGVTIIDPHGDLADHVLREVPERRLHEVTLIDLTRTDALPVLNPLDLDRRDITVRDRTIQELILLMHSRVYHQYTGPRFDEMVRFAFLTMLDEGYTEPASFVEVSPLFMDDNLQTAVKQLLKDNDLKRRWHFQNTLIRSNDYGETVHWLTSKFDDIARDSTLRVVMGGSKKTIDIEQIVQQGGILLVRIPEAIIGKQAADFVGSLIMLQLRMAIIRRREFGKLQHHHFVYVDEFQNFANTDFHTLVAEARKFNIGFTLANQNLEQLREFRTYTGYHEQRLINAIFGNVGNLIVFGVGAFDARVLSEQLDVPAQEIMRIGRYQAVAKLSVNAYETTPFTLYPEEAIRRENPRNITAIEKRMREGGYWIEPTKVREEIAGRLNRIIEKAKKQREREDETETETDWRTEEV